MSKKLTTEDFIRASKLIHGEFYNYDSVVYVGNKSKVEIVCPVHGKFLQTASHHMRGVGCNDCGRERTRQSHMFKDITEFTERARLIHGTQYDYTVTDLSKRDVCGRISIRCISHGMFWQEPAIHLAGHGCRECGRNVISRAKILSPDEVLRRAKMAHGDTYSYDLSDYRTIKDKITIICKSHGKFRQQVCAHINARHACPKCSTTTWRKENEWLDSIGVPDTEFTRQVRIHLQGKTIIADGFDPITKTVYEFWGDFWHGNLNKYNSDDVNPVNKKTFGELNSETLKKIDMLVAGGYTVKSIWENDYDRRGKVG